ncbi:hypothetical protein GF415_04630 [Candidatus Micrarchaeota archaeon]|nr:hypothetical protein [Candidatus Micrarchaeota archaeon]
MAQKVREKPTMVPTRVEQEHIVPKRVRNTQNNFFVQRRERPRNRGRTNGIRIS